jgi:hypothetical protein
MSQGDIYVRPSTAQGASPAPSPGSGFSYMPLFMELQSIESSQTAQTATWGRGHVD